MITFNGIGTTIRTPGTFVEVDNSMALQGLSPWYQRALIMGLKVSGGSGTVDELTFISSGDAGEEIGGPGSDFAIMAKAFKKINPYIELWGIPLDDTSGTQADGTIAVTGPATANGTIHLFLAGRYIPVAVAKDDADTVIAGNIKTAIDAVTDIPIEASAATATVSVNSVNKSLLANDLDMRINYYKGQSLPAGVGITIGAMASGDTDPTLTTAIANLGDERFDYIVMPYTRTAANVTAIHLELEDRFGPMRQIEGGCFSAYKDSQGDLLTFGGTQNSPHIFYIGFDDSPTTAMEWSAIYAATAAYALNVSPARPLQTLVLKSILPPVESSLARMTREERNQLLWKGIGTWTVNPNGEVMMERAVTSYQENAQALPDASYLDVNTMYQLMYIRYQFRTRMANRFPRHMLADDGAQTGPGAAVVTPSVIRSEIIALFEDLADSYVVENIDEFTTGLIVERNATDPNRVDCLLPADLVNQFRVLAALLQFIL